MVVMDVLCTGVGSAILNMRCNLMDVYYDASYVTIAEMVLSQLESNKD